MAKKLYTLTPEHRARFPEWRDKWIANAMSTSAMTEEDREICREAVIGLYTAAAPHEVLHFDAGKFRLPISREFDPFAEQARRVAD